MSGERLAASIGVCGATVVVSWGLALLALDNEQTASVLQSTLTVTLAVQLFSIVIWAPRCTGATGFKADLINSLLLLAPFWPLLGLTLVADITGLPTIIASQLILLLLSISLGQLTRWTGRMLGPMFSGYAPLLLQGLVLVAAGLVYPGLSS